MDAIIGASLDEERASRTLLAIGGHLLPGERVTRLVKTNKVFPPLDGVALTNLRVLGFAQLALARNGPSRAIAAADITSVDAKVKVGIPSLCIVRRDGKELSFGQVEADDMEAVIADIRLIAAAFTAGNSASDDPSAAVGAMPATTDKQLAAHAGKMDAANRTAVQHQGAQQRESIKRRDGFESTEYSDEQEQHEDQAIPRDGSVTQSAPFTRSPFKQESLYAVQRRPVISASTEVPVSEAIDYASLVLPPSPKSTPAELERSVQELLRQSIAAARLGDILLEESYNANVVAELFGAVASDSTCWRLLGGWCRTADLSV